MSESSLCLFRSIRITLMFRHKLELVAHLAQHELTDFDPIATEWTAQKRFKLVTSLECRWSVVHPCGEVLEQPDGDVSMLEG